MTPYEKKGWFRLELPDGWTVDESEEPLTFISPSGEGALQVTASDPSSLKPGDKVDAPLLLVTFLKQLGVKLGPGTHEVELRYVSSWLRTGFLASGASLVLLLGGLALYRRLPIPKDPAKAGDLEG